METNTNSSDINELERSVLAALVASPRYIKEIAFPLNVTEETFTIIEHRSLWRELVKTGEGDPVKLIALYAKELRLKKSEAEEEIGKLFLPNPEKLWFRVQDLTRKAYAREVQIATQNAVAKALAMNANPELMSAMIKEAVDAVPRPPEPGWAAFDAMVDGKEADGEIPEELLHIPGFIDELVEYNLKRAHRPHRTLAFSGALALLAHLMGRKFTDRRGTRPNLYLIALGNTGIGKEFARKLNNEITAKVKLSHTIANQIASGEAIEDFLASNPAALIQLDEIHKTFAALKDGSNALALGISKFLLTFYSASGSQHMMRLKASQSAVKIDPRTRIIYDPSLTLYGSGVPHIFYRSLTQDSLDDGLVGRCLVFEAVEEGASNDFEGPKPQIPSLVIALAEEMASRDLQIGTETPTEPDEIPYDEGVNDRFKEIGKEADELKKKCKETGDFAGYALWARSLERVGKIAMIYAISESYMSPVITLEGVNYAWELVKYLTKRMCKQAAKWITNGKIDEYCARIVDLLEKSPEHKLSRREISRRLKVSHDEMLKIDETLKDRGEVDIIATSSNRAIYFLKARED